MQVITSGRLTTYLLQKIPSGVGYLANKGSDNGGSTNVLPGIGGDSFPELPRASVATLPARCLPPFKTTSMPVGIGRPKLRLQRHQHDRQLEPRWSGRLWAWSRLGASWLYPGLLFCARQQRRSGRPFGTHNIGDNVIWTKGGHTLKFGYEFGDNYSNDFDNFSTRSTPNFAIFSNTGTSAVANATPFSNPTVEDAVWGLWAKR